jgi:PilZ domain-containing protein
MNPSKNMEHGRDRRDVINRRSSPRYPATSATEAVHIPGGSKVAGRLSDISRHGCYVDTISPFEVGAALTLTIVRRNQSITTLAKVVYSQVGMGMGLTFTTTEPEQIRLLVTWLGELGRGEQGPDSPDIEVRLDPAKSADVDLTAIIAELIALLRCKDVLNGTEEKAFLHKLFG